jgi:hypothetical protein
MRSACCLQRFVRRINHVLRFMSGLNVANAPNNKPTAAKAVSAANQLLALHHGRKHQVNETSDAAGQVDAQTHSAKIRADATRPAIKPTAKPFLRFGYMVSPIRLTIHYTNGSLIRFVC